MHASNLTITAAGFDGFDADSDCFTCSVVRTTTRAAGAVYKLANKLAECYDEGGDDLIDTAKELCGVIQANGPNYSAEVSDAAGDFEAEAIGAVEFVGILLAVMSAADFLALAAAISVSVGTIAFYISCALSTGSDE